MDNPLASRKLWFTVGTTFLMIILPIIYKNIGISDAITLMVEGAVAAAGSVYNVANVMSKKYEGDTPVSPAPFSG